VILAPLICAIHTIRFDSGQASRARVEGCRELSGLPGSRRLYLCKKQQFPDTTRTTSEMVFLLNEEPDFTRCAICEEQLFKPGPSNFVALLSCSHSFHVGCIAAVAVDGNIKSLGSDYKEAKCPVCRRMMTCEERNHIQSIDDSRETTVDNMGIRSVYAGKESRLVRCEYLEDGNTLFYEGKTGKERCVRNLLFNGLNEFFEGEKGAERLVLKEYTNCKTYFKGDTGNEYIVRKVFENGDTEVYEGQQGNERMVEKKFPNQDVAFYKGERNNEQLVAIYSINGTRSYFEGENQSERRIVSSELPSGNTCFYKGDMGKERLVRKEFANGDIDYYKGESGLEELEKQVRSTVSDFTDVCKRFRVA